MSKYFEKIRKKISKLLKSRRKRHTYLHASTWIVLLIWVIGDPELGLVQALPFGASTVITLMILIKSFLYISLLHYARKFLLDYVDLKEYYKAALRTSTGSGSAIIGTGLISISLAIAMYAATTS